MMVMDCDEADLADLDDEIARLYNASVTATIEVIIRDAMNHGHQPADIAVALLAALDGHIADILHALCSQEGLPNVH